MPAETVSQSLNTEHWVTESRVNTNTIHFSVASVKRKPYLHLTGSNVLVVVLKHVREEGHVVWHVVAPLHLHRFTGEQAMCVACVQ